jgi:hypothetical protein
VTRLILLGLVTLAACGSPGSSTNQLRTASENGQCVVSTGRGAGEACSGPEDCAMGCCSCAGSSKHYSAASCVDGQCSSREATCTAVERSELKPCE